MADLDKTVEMKWFSLRVISGKEQKVKENIYYELEENSLQESIENIVQQEIAKLLKEKRKVK